MNKAFVKEQDGLEEAQCPGCGLPGVNVSQAVLDYHILPEYRSLIGDEALFCKHPGCLIAYFSHWSGHVSISQLRGPIPPKNPTASLCSCFSFTWEEIEADAIEPIPTRIRQLYQKSRTPEARCFEKAPDGQCCLTEIQKIYFRLKRPEI